LPVKKASRIRFCAATAFGSAPPRRRSDAADHQPFGVVGGHEIGADLGIGVVAVERGLPGNGAIEKARVPVASKSASAARIIIAKSDARPGNSSRPSRQE